MEVVTDNNLLRQRYEDAELEGKLPLYVTTTSAQGVVKVVSGDQELFSINESGVIPTSNRIGTPGIQGFGVGVCPVLPAGYAAMPGTTDTSSDNYGNYQYSDGSVMVWVPRFYYRIGSPASPLYGAYGANAIDIAGDSVFKSEADANSAGYVLPCTFFDGGPQLGFFVDKYQCSNNGGIASSIRYGAPLSTAAAHNPISALAGAPANSYAGTIAAAKTRGAAFHPCSQFIYGALAMLSMAHAQAATATTWCAWYDPAGVTNYPKGNNNNALRDTNDTSVLYVADGYSNCGQTGSGAPFAKTTHNGQACGVADLNGNMYEVALGIQCVAASKTITAATQANPVALTIAAHGYVAGDTVLIAGVGGMTQLNERMFAIAVTDANTITLPGVDGAAFGAFTSGGSVTLGAFYAAKTAARMRDFTGGNTLPADHWGAVGAAASFLPISPGLRTDYPNNGAAQRFGSAGGQVLSAVTTDNGWILTGAGQPLPTGVSAAGSNLFGADYYYQYVRNELCLIAGGSWNLGSDAGVWAVNWYKARTSSSDYVGFRAASYL